MKILQKPISSNHKSAMFFDGVIATKKGLELRTYQDGEIVLNGQHLVGTEIVELGKTGIIDDDVLDEELIVSILVDKFISIYETGSEEVLDEDYYFDNYDDGLEVLKKL